MPVYLGPPQQGVIWDDGSRRACEDQLAAEFDARVVWLGARAWKDAGVSMYAYVDLLVETGFSLSSSEGAQVAVI